MLLICLQFFAIFVLVQGQEYRFCADDGCFASETRVHCDIVVCAPPECTTPNGEKALCVPLLSCPILKNALTSGNIFAESFVEASACGSANKLSVCCGTLASFNTTYKNKPKVPPGAPAVPLDEATKKRLRTEYVKNKILPGKVLCGQQHWDDYFHNATEEASTEASVQEFPWLMVVDSYRRCAGFFISRRFFISTVLCYFYRSSNESKIMVGVHHIKKNISCISTPFGDDCTDGSQEVKSEKVYNLGRRIVLARLSRDINYSEFVRPICLPFLDDESPKINDTVFTSGWGEGPPGSSDDYVKIKKRSRQVVVDNDICYSKFIPKFPEDMCMSASQNSSVTTCWGDEGGPVMFRKGINWFASGIVNSASDCSIEDATSATRFTPRMVERILDCMFEDYCDDHKSDPLCQ